MKEVIFERDVSFTALVGSHNYNLNDEISDEDYKSFVFPRFDDLYNNYFYSKAFVSDRFDYTVHDIRKLPDLIYKSHSNFLEVLFTRKKEIGIYKSFNYDYLAWLREFSEDLASINIPKFVKSTYYISKDKFSEIDKYSDNQKYLKAYGYNTKKAMYAIRLLILCLQYHKTNWSDFESCLAYDGDIKKHLLDIKHGHVPREKFIEEYRKFEKEILTKIDMNNLPQPNDKLYNQFKEITKSAIKAYIKESL